MDESMATLARPEIFHDPLTSGSFGVVEKPLSLWERVTNLGYVRKLVLLALLTAPLAPLFAGYSYFLRDNLRFTYPLKLLLRQRLLAGSLPLCCALT